jgi:ATP-dependent exoDNAse (exonuclease V) beta subunit
MTRRAGSAVDVRSTLERLVTPEERATAPDIGGSLQAAAEIWERLGDRSDVAKLLGSAEVFTEVPFSMRVPADGGELILRGTIDCLAVAPDGAITVVELKTGRRRERHERQLEIYVRAAGCLFPGRAVAGLLVHA